MAEQLDLMAVVKAKLADVREKATQLVYAEAALKDSRYALVEAQKDLSIHIENLKSLESEITSELTSESFSEVKEDAVADSLKVAETATDETLTEDEEPAETAVSDESLAPKKAAVKVTATNSKGGSGKALKTDPLEVVEDEEPTAADEDDSEELISIPAPEVKTTATVGGLWDDDDDDAVF